MPNGMTIAFLAGMRKNGRRRPLGRIRVWLGACVSNLSFIIFFGLIGALICQGLSLLRKPSPPPVSILIVGQTNGPSGSAVAQIILTNSSNYRISYALSTEVRKRSWWQNASVQPSDAILGNALPSASERLLTVPVPREGDEWRVILVGHRILGTVENEISELFHRFKFEYPFAKEIEVRGPEMLNPSGKKAPLPSIAAGKTPLVAAGTTSASN